MVPGVISLERAGVKPVDENRFRRCVSSYDLLEHEHVLTSCLVVHLAGELKSGLLQVAAPHQEPRL